jgi:MFS family permease
LTLAEAGFTASFYAQVASMLGSALGGWLADWWHRRTGSGRILAQSLGLLAGAPWVLLCGWSDEMMLVIAALVGWGLCKGIYDANIFAAVFDLVPAEARGTLAGIMNMVGWLAGGASAPLVGYLGQHRGLGFAIACSSLVYVVGAIALMAAALIFSPRDRARRLQRAFPF